ncbi:MAG: hypothetical protein RL518_1488 [Pseudomonadota bacterium]|jgi:hypothetical protein
MAADTTRGESEFTLFSRFSRVLSHVVRGDLSVITNEVSYLATTIPSEDLQRVRNRCSQIAATVSKIAGLKSEIAPSIVPAQDAARIFGARLRSASLDQVSLDRVKIERLASIVRQMFTEVELVWTADWSPEYGLTLSTKVPKSFPSTRRYASWSSYAAGELGERAVIDAVVADLIMRAHAWRLGIVLDQGLLTCSICIPPLVDTRCDRQCA